MPRRSNSAVGDRDHKREVSVLSRERASRADSHVADSGNDDGAGDDPDDSGAFGEFIFG